MHAYQSSVAKMHKGYSMIEVYRYFFEAFVNQFFMIAFDSTFWIYVCLILATLINDNSSPTIYSWWMFISSSYVLVWASKDADNGFRSGIFNGSWNSIRVFHVSENMYYS